MEQASGTYDVSVDEAGLDWGKSGPLFDRYSVGLSGTLDHRWAACYDRVSTATPGLKRFLLDPGLGRISFTCRSSDNPVEVMGVLKRLEEMLIQINRAANEEAARASSLSGIDYGEGEKSALAAAGGLLSRLVRR